MTILLQGLNGYHDVSETNVIGVEGDSRGLMLVFAPDKDRNSRTAYYENRNYRITRIQARDW